MKVAFATALLAGLAVAAPSQMQARDEKAVEKRLGPFGLAVAGGIVSGIVGATAKKFLDGGSKKRSAQTFQEFEGGFALNVANIISAEADADEASVCIKTGGYNLTDDVKVRALATVELTSSENDVSDFDCFFASGNGNVTVNLPDLLSNFAIKAGPFSFENGVLSLSS
ncbi:hypothetical protein M409DRAFT_59426 [Zasmidium cellare ATCC 36951]|uniref:Uncharacterized protein n=1 Tax=Zasmidium cellare ATCC 36951 TaxID=1080233 RepID=A0A6A6C601_ZASCE|nr:uncharacterized protein M409DRAFT_59426 [Zasmidium cellare ATCC 36951]KAF2161169.1 hypothetical protein M409DRAFT_59426 [Zasmidium cellare ATCC 36951]